MEVLEFNYLKTLNLLKANQVNKQQHARYNQQIL